MTETTETKPYVDLSRPSIENRAIVKALLNKIDEVTALSGDKGSHHNTRGSDEVKRQIKNLWRQVNKARYDGGFFYESCCELTGKLRIAPTTSTDDKVVKVAGKGRATIKGKKRKGVHKEQFFLEMPDGHEVQVCPRDHNIAMALISLFDGVDDDNRPEVTITGWPKTTHKKTGAVMMVTTYFVKPFTEADEPRNNVILAGRIADRTDTQGLAVVSVSRNPSAPGKKQPQASTNRYVVKSFGRLPSKGFVRIECKVEDGLLEPVRILFKNSHVPPSVKHPKGSLNGKKPRGKFNKRAPKSKPSSAQAKKYVSKYTPKPL